MNLRSFLAFETEVVIDIKHCSVHFIFFKG